MINDGLKILNAVVGSYGNPIAITLALAGAMSEIKEGRKIGYKLSSLESETTNMRQIIDFFQMNYASKMDLKRSEQEILKLVNQMSFSNGLECNLTLEG